MNPLLKYLLFPLLLLLTALPIQAEEDKWIDGIKFRNGILNNEAAFKFEDSASIYTIIAVNSNFSHLDAPPLFPIAITLPETLMNSWSFRGAVFEYQDTIETKDLAPLSVDIDKRHSYK